MHRLHPGEAGVDDGRRREPVDAGFGVAQAGRQFDAGHLAIARGRGRAEALFQLRMALQQPAHFRATWRGWMRGTSGGLAVACAAAASAVPASARSWRMRRSRALTAPPAGRARVGPAAWACRVARSAQAASSAARIGPDAGRAAGAAVAALDQGDRLGDQILAALEQRLALADAAGEGVVQIDGGRERRIRGQRGGLAVAAAQLAAAADVGTDEPGAIAAAHGFLQVARLGHHRHGGDDVQRIGGAEEAIQRLLPAVERRPPACAVPAATTRRWCAVPGRAG